MDMMQNFVFWLPETESIYGFTKMWWLCCSFLLASPFVVHSAAGVGMNKQPIVLAAKLKLNTSCYQHTRCPQSTFWHQTSTPSEMMSEPSQTREYLYNYSGYLTLHLMTDCSVLADTNRLFDYEILFNHSYYLLYWYVVNKRTLAIC